MPTLKEIIKKKTERKKRLQISLDLLIKQLKEHGALKVILFGSMVKDEIDVDSDIDLFVIMPQNKSGKEWMDFIYKSFERGISSDIIVYNKNEFEAKFPTSSFLQDIISSGRIIYEKI